MALLNATVSKLFWVENDRLRTASCAVKASFVLDFTTKKLTARDSSTSSGQALIWDENRVAGLNIHL